MLIYLTFIHLTDLYFGHVATVSTVFCQPKILREFIDFHNNHIFQRVVYQYRFIRFMCTCVWFYGLVRVWNFTASASWNKFAFNPPLFPLFLGVGLFVYWENKENNTCLPAQQRLHLSSFLFSALIDSCNGLWAVFNFFVCSLKSLHKRERVNLCFISNHVCVCVFSKGMQ